MKNNKGITLVELIISIALISIVIMFLFRLIADVRYSDKNIDYARENQQNRAIIIKTVQEDFLERGLVGLSDSGSSSSQFKVTFTYADGTNGILSVQADSVTYQNATGTEKWLLEKENGNTKYNVTCVTHKNSLFQDTNEEFFYMKFVIPVVVKADSANTIDDLEFFYVGKRKDVNISNFTGTNKDYLGNNKNGC